MESTIKPTTFKEPPIDKILRPFQEFFKIEASSGIVLIACTVIALIWANSPAAESYFALWQTKLTVGLGAFILSKPLLLWINDGLMAMFFFLVGLEIKREVLVGELSSPKQALIPIVAALGGMILPAVIFLLFTRGTVAADGWGIPMATDIAFALGVLALLGKRVPLSIKIFLTALAIVDDLGAVLVIAIFYTSEIVWSYLAIGALFLVLMFIVNKLGVTHAWIYAILGVLMWFAFLLSGVHATIAGVLAALAVPAIARINTRDFVRWNRDVLDDFETCCPGESDDDHHTTIRDRSLLQAMENTIHHTEAPLQKMEHALAYPVAFVIMPIFALANAGVTFTGGFEDLLNPLGLGIIAGLVIGKQLGVFAFTWITVQVGLAKLPEEISWRHVYGAGWLAGIGFTMSLFISGLAFGNSPLLDISKVGILIASLISGVGGWLILRTRNS